MNNTNFSSIGNTCHLCKNLQQVLLNDFKKCERKDCRKVYCIKCIDENFSQQIYLDDGVDSINDWICFSCQGMCNCKQCQIFHKDLINLKQQKPLSARNQHETHQTYSSDYLTQFRQESHSPFQYSSQLPYYNQKKSRGIGKLKKQRSLMGLKCDNNKKIPPYLISILKRKQIFKQFMLAHSKKTYEQLVNQSLTKKQEVHEKEEFQHSTPVTKTQGLNSIQNASNDFILYSPSQVPLTPSFLPLSEPLSSGLRLSQMLNEKLKQYEVEEDDLSLELL